ncbi:MAG: (2Fe-2S) ferredoxin domain-containing protein [Flavobacteriales bacterium]
MAIKDIINSKKCLFMCNGGSCMKMNAEEVTQAIRKSIQDFKLDDDYHTVRTKCMGRCDDAPVAMLAPDNIWLKDINHNQCDLLLSEIELNEVKEGDNFLYKMGGKTINSNSVPTKYRTTIKK